MEYYQLRYRFTKAQALRVATRRVEIQAARLALTAQARRDTRQEEDRLQKYVRQIGSLDKWLAAFPIDVRVAIIPSQDYSLESYFLPACPDRERHRMSDMAPGSLNELARLASIPFRAYIRSCDYCRCNFLNWQAEAVGFTFLVDVYDPAIKPVPVPNFAFALIPQGDKRVLVAVERSVLAMLPEASRLQLEAGQG